MNLAHRALSAFLDAYIVPLDTSAYWDTHVCIAFCEGGWLVVMVCQLEFEALLDTFSPWLAG